MTDKRRARGGVGEHKKLKPGQGALCESARTEQVRWSLEGRTAETISINRIAEANQAICSVQTTVRHPPGEIYNRTVYVKTKKLTPSEGPV